MEKIRPINEISKSRDVYHFIFMQQKTSDLIFLNWYLIEVKFNFPPSNDSWHWYTKVHEKKNSTQSKTNLLLYF